MLDSNAICRGRKHFGFYLFAFDAWLCRYMWCSRTLGYFIVCLRCLILMLFVVAGHVFESDCFSSMLVFDAICRGRRYFWKSLIAFDAWFWCYLWCSRAFGYFIGCLRCLILMLFVVAGGTFTSHCFSSMLDFAGICRGRTRFWKPLLVFDAWFWCYLSWPEALLDFIVCLRCLILMLFVVFQSTWPFYCLPSMLDFDGICGVPEHLAILLFALDAWFWCYLWCSRALGHFIACLRCLILMLFVVLDTLLEVIAFLRCLILTLFDVLDTHMEAPNMFSRLVNSAL